MEISQIKQKIREKWPDDYTQEHTLKLLRTSKNFQNL